jgi:hypothetical protein
MKSKMNKYFQALHTTAAMQFGLITALTQIALRSASGNFA